MKSTASVFMTCSRDYVCDLSELGIHGSFYALKQEEVEDLARHYYQFVVRQLGELSVLDWRFDKKTIKNFDRALLQRKYPSFNFYFGGLFSSQFVYNKKTMKEMRKRWYADSSPFIGAWESVDWPEYYNTNIVPAKKDSSRFRLELLKLFELEGRTYLGTPPLRDLSGAFTCHQSPFSPLFRGDFYLVFTKVSLEEKEDSWAEILCCLCHDIMKKFPNVNISVYSNCTANPYDEYYGMYPNVGLGRQFDLCLRNYYLTEVSWGEFLSPKTRRLGATVPKELEAEILLEELDGGACFLRPKNPISQVRIADLQAMKRCLYPVILPRQAAVNINQRFRCKWEKVTLFANELTVTGEKVMFQHHGMIDPERACQALSIDYEELIKKKPNTLLPLP